MCFLEPYVEPIENWKDIFVRVRGKDNTSMGNTWWKVLLVSLYHGQQIFIL